MYGSLLSVLLMGIWPVVNAVGQEQGLGIQQLAIAPPAPTVSLEHDLSASGTLILDAQSGQIVYASQATVRRPMASITKLMTALVIAENHDMTEQVKIPLNATQVLGNKAYLEAGEHFTVGELLSALLISSANDAAITLAQYHSGSVEDFVLEMNERGKQLGLKDTSFADPIGLDHLEQYSTPRDIAWLTKFVLSNEEIAGRMQKRGSRIVSREGTEVSLNHTHVLLHSSSSVIAGKTGTTGDAKQCLVSIFENGGREYIIVLLHSDSRYGDMSIIMETMEESIV